MSDEKTRWPFGGFFLKLSDEKNGTHEYEEYLRNCKENPLTEEEQREWTESARAVIAELEQLNTEPEPTRQAAEAEGISSLQTPEPAELQEGCCTGQEAEVDVVPAEAIVPLGQIGGDAPAEKERWPYASELIGDAFRHWENGRVLLDMGTGRGKNEFIIKRLASWCVDEMLTNGIIGRVLYLCPLNTLHTEKLQRRMEAAIAEADGEPMEIVMTYDMLYESMLEVQTYQHIETKYRNDPASLEKYLAPFKYIVADAIAPGPTATPMLAKKEGDSIYEPYTPSHRYAMPEELASLALFMVSGAGNMIVGDTLKKICFSGSVMPASCLSVWQQNLPDAKFVNQYGPTEATASCTYYEVDHLVSQDEQLPIGRPYNNYRVFLLNEDLTETPNGEIGEICVSGPILALGYYNDPERTEKSFIINPNYKGYPERMYRTGDYGRIREDGLLEFHGRMDRQVKHMGHRVELDEIEYAANQIAGVDECVSLYNKEKEVLYLFYSGEIAMRQVVLELRKVLPGFMVPRKVKQVSALPKLASGKIDMTTLKEEM